MKFELPLLPAAPFKVLPLYTRGVKEWIHPLDRINADGRHSIMGRQFVSFRRDSETGYKRRSHSAILGMVCGLGLICAFVLIWFARKPTSVVGHRPENPSQAARPLPLIPSRIAGDLSPRSRTPIVALPAVTRISEMDSSAAYSRATIEVCPVDAASRQPVTSARTEIKEEHSGLVLSQYDFAGQSCTVFQIDPGRYALQAGGTGYLNCEQTFIIRSNRDHIRRIVPLISGYHLHGIVRNASGRPQADAYVTVFQRGYNSTVQSDAGGHFEEDLANPHIDMIYAFKPSQPVAALGPVVLSEAGNQRIEIALPEAARTVKISGVVTDDQGRAIANADVRLIPASTPHVADRGHDAVLQGLQHVSAKTDARGRFSLEARSQNNGLLQIDGNGCESATDSMDLTDDVEKPVRLNCHPTFSVVVQDEGGIEVQDLMIDATATDGLPAIRPTAEKGRYFASSYPFKIFAWTLWQGPSDYGVTESRTIEEYQDPVRLVLGKARLDGEVIDENGEPVRQFSVRLQIAVSNHHSMAFPFSSEDGTFSLKHLPAGTVDIEVVAQVLDSDGRPRPVAFAKEVDLVDGQTFFLTAVTKPLAK